MSEWSQEPIRSIAATTRDRFDGYNLRIVRRGAVHAVASTVWHGEHLPAPACRVGNYGDLALRATAEWETVNCGRPGCRELIGSTGRQAWSAAKLAAFDVRFSMCHDSTGRVRHMTLNAWEAVQQGSAYVDALYRIENENLRQALAEYEAAHSVVAYAEQITAERAANIAAAQEAGMLFDVA